MSDHLVRATPHDVTEVFNHCKKLRSVYRHHRQGFSNDFGRTFRHRATIPIEAIADREWRRYFDGQADAKEFDKGIELFLRKHPEFGFKANQ